jgi:divalent metal cation (Fe/Co/Zn/Cd) transporter
VKYPGGPELPGEQQRALSRALRLERFTLVYMLTALVAVFFALGDSQAMKAAWLEDMLSLVPPAAFLIANRFRYKPPNGEMGWGYHRSISVGYLAGSIAIVGLGLFILIDSGHKLLRAEHPTIGMVELFDWHFWQGWLMLAVLAYTGIIPVILGRMKLGPAETLHDKVLVADAEMNRADWLTASAAAVGVVGIGFGIWWADSVAALVIAIEVLRDGFRYTGRAVLALMDARPRTHDEHKPHPLTLQVEQELINMAWVREAVVRMRELGHVFEVNAFVVPATAEGIVGHLEDAIERVRAIDWKLHDVCITPVVALEDVPDDVSPIGRRIASFEETRKQAGLTDEDIASEGAAAKPSGS